MTERPMVRSLCEMRAPAPPDGLYRPAHEHDGCGVACLARLDGRVTRETVERAIAALVNLEHRGAEGADAATGDGAGILIQIPDAFFREVAGFELPPLGTYGVMMCFLPRDEDERRQAESLIEQTALRGGPGRAGLARRARRRGPVRAQGARGGAGDPPAVPRGPGSGGLGRAGAPPLRPAARDRAARPATRSTCRAAPRARWSTRACSRRPSSRASTPTSTTRGWPAPWPSCTRASPPTPSRAGRWPIPSG